MKSVITIFVFFFLTIFGFGQNANVLVGTNGEVVSPTNFWSANITNAKSGLGLGSAATNSSSAFQPSSLALTNLANGNGSSLTNLNITNTVGILSLDKGGTGSTNASDARNNLGLGSASTNPSSAFQPSSATLSNLANNNGINITNVQASNIVGSIVISNIPAFNFTNISGTLTLAQGGTSATNASNARQNLGATTIGDAIFTATNALFARTTIGSTDVGGNIFTLANPNALTFLRINSDNTVSAISSNDFRLAVGLGTAATNPSSAFQPSSSALTNLSSNNALFITNIQASNIVGTILLASNVSGVISISNGGTGATTASGARSNLGLGTSSTNASSAFQPSSTVLSNLANSNGVNLTNITISNLIGVLTTNGNGAGLTNLTAANITGTVALASNVTETIAISNGGTGATNAAIARTNLGLSATNNIFNSLSVGTGITNLSTNNSSAFGRQHYVVSGAENSFAAGFGLILSNAGVGAGGSIVLGGLANMTNEGAFLFNGVEQGGTVANSRGNYTFAVNASNGIFLNGPLKFEYLQGVSTDTGILQISAGGVISRVMTNKSTATPAFFGWSGFSNTAFSAAEVRTNLGLAWSALTNSNSGNGLVSVNTNGEVVSPTNFWDVAPIQTLVQNFTPVVNATNAATNARTLYVYSLAISTTGVTNVVTLPTNTATKNGDEVTVIHMGPTSSITAIRQLGQTNNLITINKTDESVKFIYENSAWTNFHNISFVEPVQFSGTNVAANVAASRTNLELGWSALTNTNNAKFQEAIFTTNEPTNAGTFGAHVTWMAVSIVTNGVTNEFSIPLYK